MVGSVRVGYQGDRLRRWKFDLDLVRIPRLVRDHLTRENNLVVSFDFKNDITLCPSLNQPNNSPKTRDLPAERERVGYFSASVSWNVLLLLIAFPLDLDDGLFPGATGEP